MKKKFFSLFLPLLFLVSTTAFSSPFFFPSTFKLDKNIYSKNDKIKISYHVDRHFNNWIGIWRNQEKPNGPWQQRASQKSYLWFYLDNNKSSVVINAEKFTPGRYTAFILKENGYQWLAQPVFFDVADNNGNIELKTLMFNIWQEGTQVKGGFDAIANEIAATQPDLVSLAEVRNYNGTNLTQRLVDALKNKGHLYYSYKSATDSGILSRYPIAKHSDMTSYTKSQLKIGDANLVFYGGHLDYTHYATYLPRGYDDNFNGQLAKPVTDVNKILAANDASTRPAEIKSFIADSKKEIDAGNLVVMSGDFNEPSLLDWTAATRNVFDHHGVVIPWTSTALLQKAGFLDSYRVKYPDPLLNPGFTWLADNSAKEVSQLTWAPKADERDRIDYTFFYPNERLSVLDGTLVGPSSSIVRSQRVEETSQDKFKKPEAVWPSDHKALLMTFKLKALN